MPGAQADVPPDPVEIAIGELYRQLFRLREAGKLQEEYDAMGTLISMLSQDRQHMRVKYGARIEI